MLRGQFLVLAEPGCACEGMREKPCELAPARRRAGRPVTGVARLSVRTLNLKLPRWHRNSQVQSLFVQVRPRNSLCVYLPVYPSSYVSIHLYLHIYQSARIPRISRRILSPLGAWVRMFKADEPGTKAAVMTSCDTEMFHEGVHRSPIS